MLKPAVSPFRKRHRPARRKPAPPAALTLVSAAFDDVLVRLTLTFDRAVDVAGLVGAAVVVEDGETTGSRWEATTPVATAGPATVVLGLAALGDFTGEGVTLD